MQFLAAQELDHGVLHVLPLLLDVVVGEVVAALAEAVIAPAVLVHVVADRGHDGGAGGAGAVAVVAGVRGGVVGSAVDALGQVGDDGLLGLLEGFAGELVLLRGGKLGEDGDAVWVSQEGRDGHWSGGTVG